VAAVIITHGTDTLEETAFFLSQILPPSLMAHKPVILTCAMRPASSYAPDGPQNIIDSVAVAQDTLAKGVLVVCAGSIHRAQKVQKIHPYRLNAFDSGDAGALGFVEESRVRWVQSCSCGGSHPVDLSHLLESDPSLCPRVEIVMSYAGATGAIVTALCADASLSGIVVAATGNGTVHTHLEQALLQAQHQGIRVVRASRCIYGAIVGTEGLSPVKMRIALMLSLMNARNTVSPPESIQSAVDGH
jgi:L-asparaginase